MLARGLLAGFPGDVVDRQGEPRGPNRQEIRTETDRRYLRHRFFDVVPETGAKLRRGFHRRLAFGIERIAVEPRRRKRDAELLWLLFDRGEIGAGRRRGGIGIASLGPGGGV